MSVLLIVCSELNEGKVVGSCAARGRYDVIWGFDW